MTPGNRFLTGSGPPDRGRPYPEPRNPKPRSSGRPSRGLRNASRGRAGSAWGNLAGILAWVGGLLAGVQLFDGSAAAQSVAVVDRLSGFDSERIAAAGEWVDWPRDGERLAEVARLIYQVNRLTRSGGGLGRGGPAVERIDDRSAVDPRTGAVGDWVGIRGSAISVVAARLPEALADVLDFERVWMVEIELEEAADLAGMGDAASDRKSGEPVGGLARRVFVLTGSVPAGWLTSAAGSEPLAQPTAASGVLVRPAVGGRAAVIATTGLAWYPQVPEGEAADDLALLSLHGFDVSLMDTVGRLNGKPLLPADQAAFYGMLRAATSVGEQSPPPPPARRVDAGDLLKHAADNFGKRVRLPCQLVRVTKVWTDAPEARDLLGNSHYWQIDALGDLGNLMIRMEAGDASEEPVIFENRYPISIVAMELPPFLRALVVGGDSEAFVEADVALLTRQVIVEGFFYRLWSYHSDRMRGHGDGKQVGPLLVASLLLDAEPARGDPIGVNRIGQVAAIATALGLVAVLIWIRVTGRGDLLARARRRSSS